MYRAETMSAQPQPAATIRPITQADADSYRDCLDRVARERLRARGGDAAERERTLVFFAAMKLMRYEKKPMAPERTTEGGPEGAFLRKPCSPHAEDVGRRGARAPSCPCR